MVVLVLASTPVVAARAQTAPEASCQLSGASSDRLRLDAGTTVSGRAIQDELVAGHALECRSVTVVGDLNLRSVRPVNAAFRCQECTFEADLILHDAVFADVVDLSGSVLKGTIDARGAVFQDLFALRKDGDRQASVAGGTNFQQADFQQLAIFDGALLGGVSDFTGARFGSDASFANTDFTGPVRFDIARFGGDAVFSATVGGGSFGSITTQEGNPCGLTLAGTFVQPASFLRTHFEAAAIFRQRLFLDSATFDDAQFSGPVDLTLALFQQGASFDRASFAKGGLLRAVVFCGPLSMQRTVAEGGLSMADTEFDAGWDGPDPADCTHVCAATLRDLSISGTLSLAGAESRGKVSITGLSASNVVMAPRLVDSVRGFDDQGTLLTLLEKSARDRGDLAVANDARYRLLTLRNQTGGRLKRLADWVFYRQIAGYLVRPLHPLIALLSLLLVATVIRVIAARAATRSPPPAGTLMRTPATRGRATAASGPGSWETVPAPSRSLRASRSVAGFFAAMGRTLKVVVSRQPPGARFVESDKTHVYLLLILQWGESIAFKILLFLFLLGLANSNPTLRQIIDAVRG